MFYRAATFNGTLDINLKNTGSLISTAGMFMEFTGDVKFTKFDTSEVRNMLVMFAGMLCINSELDLSRLNTNNVVYMSYMFDSLSFGTRKIQAEVPTASNNKSSFVSTGSINLSNFKVFNCKYMNDMFARLNNVKTLDLSSFTLCPYLQNAREMFYGSSLGTIYVDEEL